MPLFFQLTCQVFCPISSRKCRKYEISDVYNFRKTLKKASVSQTESKKNCIPSVVRVLVECHQTYATHIMPPPTSAMTKRFGKASKPPRCLFPTDPYTRRGEAGGQLPVTNDSFACIVPASSSIFVDPGGYLGTKDFCNFAPRESREWEQINICVYVCVYTRV